jgi:diguanylate cyclase (GGDEF)-like protein
MTELTTSKPTILVVDDSRLMRVAARKILKEHFDILEAEDGEVAWEALQTNTQITLVMSDLSMPNLDGLGLLGKIRDSAMPLKDLPVIIVTGAEDDDGSKSKALSAGASDFITKPFESVQLLARAQAQAKQQRTQQALQQSEVSKQKLENKVGVDSLTGLANQAAFNDHLEESLSYATRHRTELALLLVQVDKYKVMFLRRGKQAAEDILCRTARLLGEGRRREDKVARTGLDTFGVLLPSANPVGARRVAEQIHAVIQQQAFDFDGETMSITASIAVASPSLSTSYKAEELLADANAKLAVAQKAGGNRVQTELVQATATQDRESHDSDPGTILVTIIDKAGEALKALADGAPVDTHRADDLARTVLPLLEAWNQVHHNAHQTLIDQLKTALLSNDQDKRATSSPSNSNAHSV